MDDKRVKFRQREQKEFINKVMHNLNSPSLKNLLSYDKEISYSNLKKYYQEKCLMPSSLFNEFCQLSRIKPESLEVEYLESNWGAVKGGKKGVVIMMEKYKSELKKWRRKGGGIRNIKKIKYPKLNEELAEFIGVYLGDGTLTKYFMRISGDYRYDLPYFNYLSSLVFRLFGINSSIYREKSKNTAYLLISSKEVCSFLSRKYNLIYGDKIRNNNLIHNKIISNKKLAAACLRGLVDTDGSVSRRGRGGIQFCVQFTSHNIKLLKQVCDIGKKLKIFTYITGKETGTNKWKNILRYFKIVGSSNMKHIVRFYLRCKEDKTIYLKDVPLYYKKSLYRNIKLPFKMDPWSSG